MADETELNDLRARIGRLNGGEQVWLLEAILADNRRRWAEEIARQQTAVKEFLELEKASRKTPTSAPTAFPPEAKREAG